MYINLVFCRMEKVVEILLMEYLKSESEINGGGVVMYAIIETGGKQYKVAEGDIIKVEKLGVDAGETVTFDQVLAVNNGELSIGCPTVAGATVTGTVVKEAKAKKVIVYKYKRKSGYHKKNGHRQLFTEIKIDKINA